ncbi:MAG: HlyD family efflux transporter periplasmic adaptor subunit [Rhodobacteraceae bacterium]|nr:HlyD family efflux transporter periplasmic adaptor subunit [Paracoccaceae bacterium]
MTMDVLYGSGQADLHSAPGRQAMLPRQALTSARPVTVSEPMSIVWNGVEYPVAHWDVHGFTLAQPIPSVLAPGLGRVLDVALLIGQGVTRIQMAVQCRLDAGDAQALRYQFIDLGRAQAELLHRIVDYAVTRQELSLTQLLNDARETRVERQETTQRMLGFRTWFQVSLACAALGAAAYMALGAFTTVKSRYAAVTAAAASVSAPAAGMVSQIDVSEGAHVTKGQVLGYLRPPDHDTRTEALQDRLRALEAEQAELRARKTLLEGQQALDAQLGTSEHARLTSAVSRARERLTLERAQLATLESTGLPTLERQQARARQRAVVLGAENDLAAADTRLQAFEAAQDHGMATGHRSHAAQTPETLDLRLAHLRDEIALAYARMEAQGIGVPVTAPCDCEVTQITRVAGEWAEPAQPLFVMAGGGARSVDALILAEQAHRIREGDRADIRLANGQQISGQVTRISYDVARAGFAGLSSAIFAAERYARIEVMPARPLDAGIGMSGSVTVRTLDPLGWLTSFLGG